MKYVASSSQGQRGITVLALVILIIIVVVAVIFLVRYLGHQPAATTSLGLRHVAVITASAV